MKDCKATWVWQRVFDPDGNVIATNVLRCVLKERHVLHEDESGYVWR
jgi:hypothetical protein